MRKIGLISTIIIIYIVELCSQNLYNGLRIPYDPCNPCAGANVTYNATDHFDQPNQVASDFGPRYVVTGTPPNTVIRPYDWHGGIDYSDMPNDGDDDKGFRLRAIVGGTIHAIGITGAKYIIIDGVDHDFGYLHIFQAGTPSSATPMQIGDCKMVLLDKPTQNSPNIYGIVVPHNGQQRLLAVCPNNNCVGRTYTYINGVDTITLTATNQVAANDIIGVLGDSGTLGAHLHLNRYESLTNCTSFGGFGGCDEYMLNPLEHIEHTGVNYTCTFHNHSTAQTNPNNEPLGFASPNIIYPGTNSSTIMVRPKLAGGGNNNHYTSATFNIRDVNLEIKETYASDYRQFKGNNYESRIIMGATDYYAQDHPNYINLTNVNNRGGWAHQGIFNFAYRDGNNPHGGPYNTQGGRPYDDYYFPFYPRIHSNSPLNGGAITFADIPINARYKDGNFNLRVRITDVRNAYEDTTTTITLDNFQPFITDFKLLDLNPLNPGIVYHLRRNQSDSTGNNNGRLTFTKETDNVTSTSASGYTMRVASSEPLESLTMRYNEDVVTMTPNASHTIWEALLFLNSYDKAKFDFRGTDYSGNQLMNVFSMTARHTNTDPIRIPVRNASTGNYII